jgi:hypothetical protein
MSNIERRIHHELKEKKYNITYENNFLIITLNEKYDTYVFKLINYPFSPPVIIYKNNKKINYNIETIPGMLLSNYINKYNECPCCVSLLCPVNWVPCNKLYHVIHEYNIVKEKIIMCQKIRFFKKIRDLPFEMIDLIVHFCV